MNYRYLYRAKRIGSPNAGEWVKGTYVHTNLGREMICDGTTYIGINRPCMIDIDVNTLCQCTGLKDKNGKLIWENDIVLIKETNYYPSNKRGIVKYHAPKYLVEIQGNFPYKHNLINSEEIIDMNATIKVEYEYEVIGNIFDNPELLEVGE